jgi:hypothetical protein
VNTGECHWLIPAKIIEWIMANICTVARLLGVTRPASAHAALSHVFFASFNLGE